MSLRIFLLFALLLPTAATCAQEAGKSDPAKAAEERVAVLRDYLRVLSAGDAEALRKFAAERLSEQARLGMPPERIAELALGFRGVVGGGLDLHRVETNTEQGLAALVRGHGEFPLFLRMEWRFDPARPGLIASRQLVTVETPADAMPAKASAEELSAELDRKLTRLAADDKFSGAILIARGGRPVWQKAYGLADREAKRPNDVETRFRLGSMNKMFTSVAVAQLVQAGKLKYTDTLLSVLPDYPDKEIARKITVHQLLTHTSGLGDIFVPEFEQKKDSLREVKDYVQLFAGKPLRFEPGAGWSYSNAGFIVLGLIIEKLSGQSYYDYVQKNIYDAAGMKSSGNTPKDARPATLAVGYTEHGGGGGLTPNWDTLPWRGMSAGGGESTLGDLLRFAEALRGHRLLSAELTETVLAGKVRPGTVESEKYAYGFDDMRAGGHRVVGHGGGAPGMNAELNVYLDNGHTVVVLSNLDPPAAQQVARYARERLR